MSLTLNVGMVIKSNKTDKVYEITHISESRNKLYAVNVNDSFEKLSHFLDRVISAIETNYYTVVNS